MSTTETQAADAAIPQSSDKLASSLENREHSLASDGDAQLAEGARAATKDIFDHAISLEPESHPHSHPFLVSISQPPSIGLRSSTRQQAEEPEPAKPEEVLPYTPSSVSTVDGSDPEQIWAQLELRNEGVCKVVKEVGTGEEPEVDDDDEEGEGDSEEDDSEEMGSDEEMSIEEWNRMMAEGGYEEGDSASGSEDEEGDSEDDSEDEDDTVQFEDGTKIGDSDSEMDEDEEDDDEDDEDDEEDDEDDEEDDEDDEEEEEEEDDDDDEDIGNPDVDMDDDDGLFPTAGPSKRKKAKHPTLDDEFFSIDDFNRMTEEQEAERVTSGRLGGDEEDDEPELDDFSSMFLASNDNPAEMTYADFFAPPARDAAPSKKGKGKDAGKKKKKAARFEESEDEDEDEGEEVHGVMDRVKTDSFEDSEDEGDEVALSTHEKRQRELAEQIAELEQQAIGPKDWTLMGEASSRARPENSLLEENLDFEHVAKAVPVITEESVATLEESIKKRILDGNFDSPVRVRAFEPTAFLPSRFFESDDKQSAKSSAQIYEDEYTAEASGTTARDPRDDKLAKEHQEIDRSWDEVCYKSDALSSSHFVPKAPKAAITTVDNIATASMETASPAQQRATSMLAPQESFAGPSAADSQARSEQTPEEAKRARSKARKARKATRQRIDATAQSYGKKKMTVREEKDAASNQLVKSGKGVTVLGKGAKEEGKKRKRDEGEQDGKRSKL